MNAQSQVRGDKTDHRWKLLVHMDGCHWFASTYICRDCDASFSVTCERAIAEDPWSAVWMDEGTLETVTDDEGNKEEVLKRCDRCEELLAGAEPKSRLDFQPA